MRQKSFAFIKDYKKEFGGALLVGQRKTRRPLSTKKPIHLVLRSNQTGVFSPSNRSLHELVRAQAKRFGIRIYDFAVNWSHLHMVIRIKDRRDYVGFIRVLTAILSLRIRRYLKERGGRCLETTGQLFDLRPYTRIVEWGRHFKRVMEYQILNQMEARGLVRRELRGGVRVPDEGIGLCDQLSK